MGRACGGRARAAAARVDGTAVLLVCGGAVTGGAAAGEGAGLLGNGWGVGVWTIVDGEGSC